jgi:heme/copper-type cytochrome/quinol oxidase subunit 2
MRIFALPVALIVVAALIYVLVVLLRGATRSRTPEPTEPPRWETHTAMEDGWTLVLIRQVAQGPNGPIELTKQTVRVIPDDDPNWDERYREAMLEARSRITTLELESG